MRCAIKYKCIFVLGMTILKLCDDLFIFSKKVLAITEFKRILEMY